MAVLLGSVVVLRILVGEGRVASLGISSTLMTSLGHMTIGPLVGFGSYFYKAAKLALHLDPVTGLAAVGGTLCTVLLLRWLGGAASRGEIAVPLSALPDTWREMARAEMGAPGGTSRASSPGVPRLLKAALIGLAMLVLAYPLTLTTEPIALVSRGTRVHFAGAIGAGLIWASFGELTLAIASAYRLRGLAYLGIAALFGLSFAYDLTVQQDYSRAWTLERTFWQGVLGMAQDIRAGTMILVGGTPLPEVEQIGANTWAVPRILPELFRLPELWSPTPRAYRLVSTWTSAILTEDGRFQLDENVALMPPELGGDVAPSDTILLIRKSDGALTRPKSIDIGHSTFSLKAADAQTLGSLATTPLYHLLMASSP